MKSPNEISDIVRETAYAIHLYLGHGHLEKVYENALVHRLQKAGLHVIVKLLRNYREERRNF
ncbi:MAG: GxxExxY protein [Chthoniobacterales bacterium]|nr:GxxExxY protein [Chthoniobacterales bacterium]